MKEGIVGDEVGTSVRLWLMIDDGVVLQTVTNGRSQGRTISR